MNKVEFNDKGQKLTMTLQLRYEDLEVFKYPSSCGSCPVGFMEHNCGRNVPFTDKDFITRPPSCKLRLVDISTLIDQVDIV